MSTETLTSSATRPPIPKKNKPILPSPVLGMIVFVLTEIMFFTALISAFLVIKAGAGAWTPPESVRLPVEATAINTLVLMISGCHIFLATRFAKKDPAKTHAMFLRATLLGAIFVGFQGYEWIQLLEYGMTLTSGIFAACFFLVIGSHALHAFSAIIAMAVMLYRARTTPFTPVAVATMAIYWYLIVGVWPILYGLVYF